MYFLYYSETGFRHLLPKILIIEMQKCFILSKLFVFLFCQILYILMLYGMVLYFMLWYFIYFNVVWYGIVFYAMVVLKTYFRARPINHRKKDRIIGHFMVCYTALLIYRLMKVKARQHNYHFTTGEIIENLKNMKVLRKKIKKIL